jgi:two-component system phosphate regulon response regulator PhoB
METGSGRKILIIEDETDVVDLLTLNLRNAGYNVLTVADGAAGLQRARDDGPDLIILDLLLPKTSGLEVCRILKSDPATAQIPILILTAKVEEIDRVVGLELGADDYVTKPFSPREVVLRIRAILRRGKRADESLNAGPISIDPGRHKVRVNGKQVPLTKIEFKLLRALMQHRGRVAQRDRLLKEVWGYDNAVNPRTVDAHVRRLRKKLGKARDAVQTVRDFGYRLEGS